jgi:hypothetical protein
MRGGELMEDDFPRKVGFDDPAVFKDVFRTLLEKEVREVLKEVLKEEGFHPSEENPNVWVREEAGEPPGE